jgi:hypothetical protein
VQANDIDAARTALSHLANHQAPLQLLPPPPPRPPAAGSTALVAASFYVHLRIFANNGNVSEQHTAQRLLRSWRQWDAVVSRSAHAAAVLHSADYCVAEKSVDSLTGGFLFALRVQRDGGKLQQRIALCADTVGGLPACVAAAWAAQAGLPTKPFHDEASAGQNGSVADADEFQSQDGPRHSSRALLSVADMAAKLPMLQLATQPNPDADTPGAPARVFKVVRVTSVASSPPVGEPLSHAALLTSHPRLATWLTADDPACVHPVSPTTHASAFQEAAAARSESSGVAAAADNSSAPRKRRREADQLAPVPAAASNAHLPAVDSAHLPPLLLTPQPGDIIVTVNGHRPHACDLARQLLYGVHQGVSVDETHEAAVPGGLAASYVPLPLAGGFALHDVALVSATAASSAALSRRSSRLPHADAAAEPASFDVGPPTAVAPEAIVIFYRPALRPPPPPPESMLRGLRGHEMRYDLARDAGQAVTVERAIRPTRPSEGNAELARAFANLPLPVLIDSYVNRYGAAVSAARSSILRQTGTALLLETLRQAVSGGRALTLQAAALRAGLISNPASLYIANPAVSAALTQSVNAYSLRSAWQNLSSALSSLSLPQSRVHVSSGASVNPLALLRTEAGRLSALLSQIAERLTQLLSSCATRRGVLRDAATNADGVIDTPLGAVTVGDEAAVRSALAAALESGGPYGWKSNAAAARGIENSWKGLGSIADASSAAAGIAGLLPLLQVGLSVYCLVVIVITRCGLVLRIRYRRTSHHLTLRLSPQLPLLLIGCDGVKSLVRFMQGPNLLRRSKS